MTDRRMAPRRRPGDHETLSGVRLRAGGSLVVIDLSETGALVEGAMRLLPGTHVEVHVVTRDGRTLVRSRVLRAFVVQLAADGVRYRAALAFERRLNTEPSWVAATQTDTPGALAGSAYPNDHANDVARPKEGTC
jgi:hypothetical protein